MLTDDPLAALERQLVEAAQRPSVRETSRGSRSRLPRSVVLALAAALAVALPAGAATGVWTGLFSSDSRPPAPRVVNEAPSAQLRNVLGVLRRPQRPSDRDPEVVRWADWGATTSGASHRSVVELPGVRLANNVGAYRLFLVPFAPNAPQGSGGDTIKLVVTAGRAGPSAQACCLNAAAIRAGAPGPNLITETRGAGTVIAFVVPDGVARIGLQLAGSAARSGRERLPERSLSLPVRGNVAAARVQSGVSALRVHSVTWYDHAGRAIKRFGP